MRQLKISRRITSRESAALDKYLSEISRIQTLTPEQEVSLAQKWKLGDQYALELLVKSKYYKYLQDYLKKNNDDIDKMPVTANL